MRTLTFVLFVLLSGPVLASACKEGSNRPAQAIAVSIEQPFEEWYPFSFKNTSPCPVCFQYDSCDDIGPALPNGICCKYHKLHCVTKTLKLKPGEAVSPDQNYKQKPAVQDPHFCK